MWAFFGWAAARGFRAAMAAAKSPLSRADSAERIWRLVESCGEEESASRVPAGRFWAAAGRASRSAKTVRLRGNFCIQWLDPLPRQKVCKVLQKKDLEADL